MKRQSVHLELEQLENRVLPAPAPTTFYVKTTDDNGNNANPLPDSIRAAIIAVDKGTKDTIDFSKLNALGPIMVNTNPLPSITRPVLINGNSYFRGNIGIQAGFGLPAGANGLTFDSGSDGSQVVGLSIDGFPGDGIELDSVSFVLIGEKIDKGTNQVIFGSVALYQNDAGLMITNGATNNSVFDSFFGTNIHSAHDLGNNNGIVIKRGASNNTIGGTAPNEMNIISGNKGSGLLIEDANNNRVSGNYIGMEKDGTTALANNNGVTIQGNSTGNQTGLQAKVDANGVETAPSNLISGNTNCGVEINGVFATGNTVAGNWIGVNINGNAPPAKNQTNGVVLSSTPGNTIGGGQGHRSMLYLGTEAPG